MRTTIALLWVAACAPALAQIDSGVERRACEILRAQPRADAAFPGARAYLCETVSLDAAYCMDRRADCTRDTVCAVAYESCKAPPCPPVVRVAGCGFADKRKLAALVTQYPVCAASGGTWEPRPGRSNGWQGVCSCMGSSPEAVAFTVNGWTPRSRSVMSIAYYVAERGCVSEKVLCTEHRGTWISERPPQYRSERGRTRSECLALPRSTWAQGPGDPGTCTYDYAGLSADPFQAYCAIAGAPARWHLLERIGFDY